MPRGDQEAEALKALRSLFWAAQEDYRQLEQATGLSSAEVRALTLVAQHPGLTVSALASKMRLSLPSISNMLRHLVASGLVTRTRLEKDQRTVLLHATAQAQTQLSQSRGGGSGLLKTLIDELDDNGLQQLNGGLRAMLTQLGTQKLDADPLPVTALREGDALHTSAPRLPGDDAHSPNGLAAGPNGGDPPHE
jgi:DNA-binding MarR family transcriptional regulator